MKKLYLIFAVIFLLILSSCGVEKPPIEPSPAPEIPSQSETETSQPKEETPTEPEPEQEKEPNLNPEHLLDFGDGLEYIPVDKESKTEVSAVYLARETVTAIFSPNIEGYVKIDQGAMQHFLVMIYGSGLDGNVYDEMGNPYDKTKLPYTGWARMIDDNNNFALYFNANACEKIVYEVFGMENFKIEKGYLGFKLDKATGEYYTPGGFSPSATFMAHSCKIAYPDENTVAVRFVVSDIFGWMGADEGWSYIGEGKMTFEIMQNEEWEDFLRYKKFEYFPYEAPVAP